MRGVVRVTTTTGVRLAYELDARGTPFDGTPMISGSGTAIRDVRGIPGDHDLSLQSHPDDYLVGALGSLRMAKHSDQQVENNAKRVNGSLDSVCEHLKREGHVDTSGVSTDVPVPQMPLTRHPYAVMLSPAAVVTSPEVARTKHHHYSVDWTPN